MQSLLGRSSRNADALRDRVRTGAIASLGDRSGVLVVDETGFLKQGKASCGVARQYTGSAGKITNCQIGVFACYVSRHGHAFIDRALYLPKAYSVYGVGDVEKPLRQAGKGYVLGVAKNHSVKSWGKAKLIAGTAESVAQGLAPSDWKRLSAGDGAKGPRLCDWAYVELADIEASAYGASRSGLWTRGLLIRRTIADQDLAFFSTWAPVGTLIDKLVRVEGCRWAIEDSFETAKNELGLDHNETRSWHGWNRHVSLVMLAFAMMATIRHRANKVPAQPQTPPKIPAIRRLYAGLFRKYAV